MKRLPVLTLVCLLLLAGATGVALAQIEAYAVTHPFALATATTTRLFGMGGISSCIPDRGFANPAFAGQLTGPSAVAREATTSFDWGLRLSGLQGSVAQPLNDNVDGVQITGFQLSSNDAVVPGVPPLMYSMAETDVSVHYGRRLAGPWLVGIAVSPVFHNALNIDTPLGPLLRTRSKADWGFRVGGVYEIGARGWIGATYDRYDENVVATGALVGGGPVSATFHSQEMIAGAAYRLDGHWLAAVEWQELSSRGAGVRVVESGLRGGLEGRFKDLSVRVGSNQGASSLGLGWAWRGFVLNYAYIKNWNHRIFGPGMGSSNTHSLEVTCAF